MGEHGGAVGLDVFVEPQAKGRLGQDGGERGFAQLQRLAPQVVAVQLDQVERVQEHARVVPPVTNAVEARHALVSAGDRLAVDDQERERSPPPAPGRL